MGREANGDWNPTQLVGSLPVQNVQALAAATTKGTTEIPQRYIRPGVEEEDVLGTDNDEDIPIVNLGRLVDPTSSEDESSKLKFALEDWGFFQVVNHGIPEEVIERIKADVQGFFELPLEEKKAYAQLPGGIEGYGQGFVVSEEQKLDWADIHIVATRPVSSRNMQFWPTQPPTFRDSLDKYSTELNKVTNCLLGFMAKNLGLPDEELVEMFDNCGQSLRLNYYPPCPQADKVFGLAPHSDGVGLTLLLKVTPVPGLQIRRNGRWVTVNGIPNALIFNIGDVLEIITNGRFRSIEHRAIVNPNVKRISIAAFHSPNNDVLVGPLPKLVEAEGTEHYKTVTLKEYYTMGRRFLSSSSYQNEGSPQLCLVVNKECLKTSV